MGVNSIESNVRAISRDLNWLREVIEKRFNSYFQNHPEPFQLAEHPFPERVGESAYYDLVDSCNLGVEERAILLLAIAPHVNPSMLDVFFTKNSTFDRGFTEFGGLKGEAHSGFLPTAETAAFIIHEANFEKRLAMLDYFSNTHPFYASNILHFHGVKERESLFNGALALSEECLDNLLRGRKFTPQYTSKFPAKLLTTKLDWEDAIFDHHTRAELSDISVWIEKQQTILENAHLKKYLKNGYKALFYGPPGTGKTMTTALLGKKTGLDVYQVDLSAVVSKYIGETEKNLAALFDLAENKNWILFFDEADAMFGKRTQVQSSNDQHANQQVGYLLQRIEDYNGIVILASNYKDNIDNAFLRRFQSIVYFAKPNAEFRLRIWEKYFEETFDLMDVDLEKIASDYEMAGGAIINVLRFCSIAAAKRDGRQVYHDDIVNGIKRELVKEGLTV